MVPEYGAIFMSNTITRSECFGRNLFGLPLKHANFVMKVKTGMVLFLFDYMKRTLFGVFEATCDGKINISSNAWGKEFPAQVRFRLIWRCRPLSECTFRDAIKENYYDRNKFYLGLSKDQVTRLLFLFEKTRIRSWNAQSFLKCSENEQMCCKTSTKVMSPKSSKKVVEKQEDSSFESQPKQESLDSQTFQMKEDAPIQSQSEQNSENSPISPAENKMDLSDTDLGDYIPLPLLDPEEIEFLFPDECAEEGDFNAFACKGPTSATFSGISSPSTSASEEGEFRPKRGSFPLELHRMEADKNHGSGSYQDKDVCSDGSIDVEGNVHPYSASKSNSGGFCEAAKAPTSISEIPMKPGSCLPEPEFKERGGYDDEIHHSFKYEVKKLYSDSPEKRASVFSRLARRSEVTSPEKSDFIEADTFPHLARHKKAVSLEKFYTESDLVSRSCRFSKTVSHRKKGRTVSYLFSRSGTKAVSQEKTSCPEGDPVYEVINRPERTSNKWKNNGGEKAKTILESSGTKTTGGRISVFSRLKNKKTVDNVRDDAAQIRASKFSQASHRKKVEREVLLSSHYSRCGGSSTRSPWGVPNTHVKGPRRASENIGGASAVLNSKRRGDNLNRENENHSEGVGDEAEKQCSSEKKLKRRRLDRQGLEELNDNENFLCKNCSDLRAPSQESSAAMGNCGSCNADSNISDEGICATSKNVSLNVVFPINSEGNGTTGDSKGYVTADKDFIVNDQDIGELSGDIRSCPPQCNQEAIEDMTRIINDPDEKVIAGLEEPDIDLQSSYEGSAEPFPLSARLNAEAHLNIESMHAEAHLVTPQDNGSMLKC